MAYIAELTVRIKADAAQLSAEMRKVQSVVNQASGTVTKNTSAMKRGFDDFKGSAASLAPILASALSIKKIIDYADTWKLLTGKLQLATEATGNLAEMQTKLFELAQETRSDLGATVTLYQRAALAAKTLSLSQKELLLFTEQVNKQMRVGGLSSQEAAASVYQLTQALNKGTLNGDEFRTIMESMPPLIEALSVSLKKSKGEIIAMAAAGKLSAATIISAVNSMADTTNDRFSKLPVTIGEAFTRLNNAMTVYIGTSRDMNNASNLLVSAINFITENVDILTKAGIALSAAVGTRLVIGLGLAVAAATPVTLAITALATAFTVAVTNADALGQELDILIGKYDNLSEGYLRSEKLINKTKINKTSEKLRGLREDKSYYTTEGDLGLDIRTSVIDSEEARLKNLLNKQSELDKLTSELDEKQYDSRVKSKEKQAKAEKEKQEAVEAAKISQATAANAAAIKGKTKEINDARKSLADYNLETERRQKIALMLPKEQAGMESYYKTLDLAQKAGIKNAEQLAEKNRDIAESNYAIKEAQDEARRSAEQMRGKLSDALTDAILNFNSASDAAQNFAKAIAATIIQKKIAEPFANAIVGNGSEGSGIIGSVFSSLGLPSYDVGTDRVPQDMVARIHKDEIIIPAVQSRAIRNGTSSGGGGSSIVVQQYFQVSNDVPALIDAKIRNSAPIIANAAHDAVFASMQRGGSASKIAGLR